MQFKNSNATAHWARFLPQFWEDSKRTSLKGQLSKLWLVIKMFQTAVIANKQRALRRPQFRAQRALGCSPSLSSVCTSHKHQVALCLLLMTYFGQVIMTFSANSSPLSVLWILWHCWLKSNCLYCRTVWKSDPFHPTWSRLKKKLLTWRKTFLKGLKSPKNASFVMFSAPTDV
jgi:hypothetical protein